MFNGHFKTLLKLNKRVKFVLFLLSLAVLIMAGFVILYYLNAFFDHYRFKIQTPIVLQKPIILEERIKRIITPIPTLTATPSAELLDEEQLVKSQKHGEILWKIYQLETQRGKTDSCRLNNNGYGGFGVMYDGEVICYKSFKEATERAEYWLTSFGVDKNLVDALCIWNLGRHIINNKVVPHQNCGYYQKYLSL